MTQDAWAQQEPDTAEPAEEQAEKGDPEEAEKQADEAADAEKGDAEEQAEKGAAGKTKAEEGKTAKNQADSGETPSAPTAEAQAEDEDEDKAESEGPTDAAPSDDATDAAPSDAAAGTEIEAEEGDSTDPDAPDPGEAEAQQDATAEQTAGMWEPTAPEAEEEEEAPAPTAPPEQPQPSGPELLEEDVLRGAGYLPGYRRHKAISASRYAPHIGSRPGGVTPGFGAPMLGEDWTFKFAGFMTVSAQYSLDYRRVPAEGQAGTVFHVPPQTVDTYYFFTSTSTVPGNWVGMRFSYGNSRVTATMSLDTWNPTRPTTYYQLGSQYFINNAYLDFTPSKFGDLKLKFRVGRFNLNYGGLGQYGSGIYVQPVTGGPRGIGFLGTADYSLSDKVTLHGEYGLMASRDGSIPEDVVPSPQLGWRRPVWAGSWMPHGHVGFTLHGTPELKVEAHYISEFSSEDRNDLELDIPGTVQVDESDVPDARIRTYGIDARLSHDSFGWLGAGASYTNARNAYVLRGLFTYGGIGEQLTDRYLGATSQGNGGLFVFGLNYNFSIGKIVNYPGSFSGDGPDITINTGFHLVRVSSPFEEYDGKVRHKYGIDGLYTFHRNVGIGLRVDRVVPNSKDGGETFHVLAPRLTFKTDWITHEQIQLIYGKWFYGPRTRNEGTGLRTLERLDDEMIALNFNMWW